MIRNKKFQKIKENQTMAKTTNCALCGKEMTSGFFTGNAQTLDMGISSCNIVCCEECYEKYKKTAKRIRKRFSTKCEHLRKARKAKLSQKELGQMFFSYLKEEKECLEKCRGEVLDQVMNFFSFNDNGFFSVKEFGTGFSNQDISAGDMLKSIEKSQRDTDCLCFDKNDITKIEYAKIGIGDFNGLFQKIYSFAIRLNDEKVMTYKPTVTRALSYGSGFLFGYERSAEKRLRKTLNEFKKQIGSELPIVKVRKI